MSATLDFPFVTKVNWPHGQTLQVTQATALLANLRFELSIDLAADVIERQPAVVQVWFESNNTAAGTTGSVPATLAILHGSAKLDPQTIAWRLSDVASSVTKLLAPGGRLLLRLHTGVLLDKDRRAFSAALDALVGDKQPHLPGGVFEGWVMVQPG